jgi:hypothetical protein
LSYSSAVFNYSTFPQRASLNVNVATPEARRYPFETQYQLQVFMTGIKEENGKLEFDVA